MRDSARIDRLLNKIRAFWLANPDLRLGQLLVNFSPPARNGSVFYVEDDWLEAQLDAEIARPSRWIDAPACKSELPYLLNNETRKFTCTLPPEHEGGHRDCGAKVDWR